MKLRLLPVLAMLLLAGCADPQLGELDRRLTDIRNNPGTPPPLEMPEVPDFQPSPYQESERRSPFRPQRSEPERAPAGSNELAPDPERVREPLEAYELGALRLVGILTMGNRTHALVRAPDGEVHQLRVGNYMGRNHGRIVSITDSTVQLIERVPTAGGGWVERTSRLTLSEARR